MGTSCNREFKKDLPNEKDDSKLIKNTGNGNVQRFLQDKSGNLWFGTTDNNVLRLNVLLLGTFDQMQMPNYSGMNNCQTLLYQNLLQKVLLLGDLFALTLY